MKDTSKLYYSVLKYIPNAIRMETINVGVAVHYPSKKYSHFFKTNNMRRVAAFDDEYNKAFFSMVMESLEYDLDYNLDKDVETLNFNLPDESDEGRFNNISDPNYLTNKVSYLTNEFRFSSVQAIYTSDENWKSDVEDLKSTFLYYDKPKNERISKEKVRSLLNKQIRSFKLPKDQVKLKPEISNSLGVNDIYDFQIAKTLLRSMSFDYKRKDNLVKELKVILYDLGNIKPQDDISSVLLISNELEKPEDENVYDNFLKSAREIASSRKYKVDLVQLDQLKDKLKQEISFFDVIDEQHSIS
ncbi:DUF3037 domain-containing protein [Lactobacillus hominis]|uniref:DUF3037 domain-containing protein n=1 Tax=Lactobacillus hominis TaxID=1203033 RepID=UPI0023F25C1F|nr:DUF3037 domain-containing protein [Lactobacillus hominis]